MGSVACLDEARRGRLYTQVSRDKYSTPQGEQGEGRVRKTATTVLLPTDPRGYDNEGDQCPTRRNFLPNRIQVPDRGRPVDEGGDGAATFDGKGLK